MNTVVPSSATGPPDPVPSGWLERFGWRISRAEVEALAAAMRGRTAFLGGSVENEADVRDLFDLVICVVIDNETLRNRLLTRTTNFFGKHPEELAAALGHNDRAESASRRLGAVIVDGRQPPAEVADAILAAAARPFCHSAIRPFGPVIHHMIHNRLPTHRPSALQDPGPW